MLVFFSLVAVAFSSVFIPALGQSCTLSYTVKSGDICDSISANNDVSTYQLAVLNPSINPGCTNISPGQTLCLGTTGYDCTPTYKVKLNDDCDVISSTNQINTTVLTLNNPQLNADCSNLYVGEVLCVAGTVIVPPPPSGSNIPASVIPSTALPARPTGNSDDDNDDDDGELEWCD